MGYIITFVSGFILGATILAALSIHGDTDEKVEAYNNGYIAGYNKGIEKTNN